MSEPVDSAPRTHTPVSRAALTDADAAVGGAAAESPKQHGPPRPTHFVALRLPPESCVHRSIAALHSAFNDSAPPQPIQTAAAGPQQGSDSGAAGMAAALSSERARWRHALYGLDRAHLTLAVVACEIPAAVAAMTAVVENFFRRHGYLADISSGGADAVALSHPSHFRLRFPCALGNFGGNRVVFVSPQLNYTTSPAAAPVAASSPPHASAAESTSTEAMLAAEAARFVSEVAALRRELAALEGVTVVSGGGGGSRRGGAEHHYGAHQAHRSRGARTPPEPDSPLTDVSVAAEPDAKQLHDIHVTLAKIGRRNHRRLRARRIPHDLIQIAHSPTSAASPAAPPLTGNAASAPAPTAAPTTTSSPAAAAQRPVSHTPEHPPPSSTRDAPAASPVRVHLPAWDATELVRLTEGGLFTMDWDRVLGNWAYVPQRPPSQSRTPSPGSAGGSPHDQDHLQRHGHHHQRHRHHRGRDEKTPPNTSAAPPSYLRSILER